MLFNTKEIISASTSPIMNEMTALVPFKLHDTLYALNISVMNQTIITTVMKIKIINQNISNPLIISGSP